MEPMFDDPVVSTERSWQRILAEAVRQPSQLAARLQLGMSWARRAERAAKDFPLLVTEPYLARIRPGDPLDPLLVQVLPVEDECRSVPGYDLDPVGERGRQVLPGMIQKYQGRVLLVVTGACAIHCRYCFRRHFPYSQAPKGIDAWESALQQLEQMPEVHEVILSGGDPLMVTDQALKPLIERLGSIAHIDRLRIHTRLPIVVPQRVTDPLIAMLGAFAGASVMVVHVNHAREIDRSVVRALERLRCAGVMLLNQAVLLRRVNDTLAAQVALSERLIEGGVVPYYLHQLDQVAGAAHFYVSPSRGREIVGQMQSVLPGYAVPRYVQDVPGRDAKTSLM